MVYQSYEDLVRRENKVALATLDENVARLIRQKKTLVYDDNEQVSYNYGGKGLYELAYLPREETLEFLAQFERFLTTEEYNVWSYDENRMIMLRTNYYGDPKVVTDYDEIDALLDIAQKLDILIDRAH